MTERKRIIKFLIAAAAACCFCLLLSACGGGEISVGLYSGGTLYKTVTVSEGKGYSLEVPKRVGYGFLGWYDSESGGRALTDGFGQSAGLTWSRDNGDKLYAGWKAKSYKLFFEYNGATAQNGIESADAVYDSQIEAVLPAPQKSGYTFAGWATDRACKKLVTDKNAEFLSGKNIFTAENFPLNSDDTGCTLYAAWKEKTAVFNFETNGGDAVDSREYAVGKVITELPSTAKDDHAFIGWFLDSTLLTPIELPYVLPDNLGEVVTVYAKYESASPFLTYSTHNNDREYRVAYSGDAERIVVPDKYFGKRVTAVGAFSAPNAKEIVLCDSITEFISGAFKDHSNLERIRLPGGVKRLPNDIFAGCGKLKEFKMPAAVESIGSGAFASCESLTEMYITAGVTAIGDGAFRSMTALEGFEVSEDNQTYKAYDGVLYRQLGTSFQLVQYPASKKLSGYTPIDRTTKIFDYAFSGCSLTVININGRINSIGENAFENSAYLMNVIFDNTEASGLTIGRKAFSGCGNLKSVRVYLNTVPVLGADAFKDTNNVFCVYVPTDRQSEYRYKDNWRDIYDRISSVGMIFGDYAVREYADGYSLKQYFGDSTNLILPDIINGRRVLKIDENAFSHNRNLVSVTVNASVGIIEENAFAMCANLVSVTMLSDTPPTLGATAFSGVNIDFVVYIDNSPDVLALYEQADGWKEFDIYTKS